MSKLWRGVAAAALAAGLLAATELSAIAAPNVTSAVGVTIGAMAKLRPITGDVLVIYSDGSYSSAAIHGTISSAVSGDLGFAFHVTLNILAYSAFAISFVLSIIFLVQNRRLRNRKLGVVGWRFPALDVLERMTRSSVLIGCASLAAGMTAGLIWAHRLEGQLLGRRSKSDHHGFDFFDLCRLHVSVADRGVARGARFGALHIQFYVCDFQLQYREPVSFPFSPILLSRVCEQGIRGADRAFRKWKSFSSD